MTAVSSDAGHCVEAEVEGKYTDEVTLFLTHGNWSSECTCPMGTNCRHAAAAACAWIASAGRDLGTPAAAEPVDEDDDCDDDFPAPLPPVSLPRRELPKSTKKKPPFRDEWSPVIAAKLGRPFTAEEGRQLGQLAALFADFHQSHRGLYPEAMRKHGFGDLLPPGAHDWTPLFQGWWDYGTAPSDPWMLWQYIA